MKKIFSTAFSQSKFEIWLLFLRIFSGSFILTHGLPKFLKIVEGDFQFADPLGIGQSTSLLLAAFAEFFCSILIIAGIFTRLATLPLIATMSVAAFIFHSEDPFSIKEMALLYLLVFITILIAGPGKYSADHFIYNSRKRKKL